MAKNIKVNDVTYNAVSSIEVPLAAGGGNAVFPDTSDANAAEGNILSGKTAYVNGSKLTGNMANNSGDVNAVSYHQTGTSLHIVPAEGYTDGVDDATVITDADFVAGNIKNGVSVFGLSGTLSGGGTYQEKSVTPSASQQVITPDTGYDAMTKVTVAGDVDLISNNIKSGKNIFGVAGSTKVVDTTIDFSDAADSDEIKSGKKAYVNGQLVTGTAQIPQGGINVAYDATSVTNFDRTDPPFIIAVYAPTGDVGAILIDANGDGGFYTLFDACPAQYDNYTITFDMSCIAMFGDQSWNQSAWDDYIFVDVTNDNYLP